MKTLAIYFLIVLFFTISHAQPICRGMNVFPFQSCRTVCQSFSEEEKERCADLKQFGCELQSCQRRGIQCTLTAYTPCPNDEIPVTSVDITPNKSVEFNLAIQLRGYPLDVVFLIDGSPSMRTHLRNIRGEMNALIRRIMKDLPSFSGPPRVGVAAYGGEGSFDETGHRVIQRMTENADEAIAALDRIPTTVDGPRSTIAALLSLTRNGRNTMGIRQPKTVYVLVGDRPGREPDCETQLSRGDAGHVIQDRSDSLIAVSVGNPGLDAAIDPVTPCPGENQSRPIARGQGSSIASDSNGELQLAFNTGKVWAGIDRARRRPLSPIANVPTSIIGITTAHKTGDPRCPPHICPPPPKRGCLDKVVVTTDRELGIFTGPTQFDTKVTLKLSPGVCENGPFDCEIRTQERRISGRISPGELPFSIENTIKVNACADK